MPPTPRPGCVLLVDDDADVRRVLACVLEAEGLRVVQAQDGAEALALLPVLELPCVAVLDMMMPRVDGEAVLSALSALDTGTAIHVVVLSAAASLPHQHPLVRATLPKPFRIPEVRATIARVHAHAVATWPGHAHEAPVDTRVA